jgi:5-dehydro-4-deoxyglucarate dehydratase
MHSENEIRSRLRGPVCSILVPFTKDSEIDEPGVLRIIDVALSGGCEVVMIPGSDSVFPETRALIEQGLQHQCALTDDDVSRLTRLVVEHVAGRALTIVGDRFWWTGQVVEFARWCRDLGADIILVRPPTWGRPTPESLAAHYEAVAEVLPVMFVGELPKKTLAILASDVPGVVAFLENAGISHGFEMARHYADRFVIVSSGRKWAHYVLWPYGCPAWISQFITYAPQVAQTYWQALQRGDTKVVKEAILNIDEPWWELADTLPGGADALWHVALELFGVAQRWRRLPYDSADDAQMEQARALYERLGLL